MNSIQQYLTIFFPKCTETIDVNNQSFNRTFVKKKKQIIFPALHIKYQYTIRCARILKLREKSITVLVVRLRVKERRNS